MKTSIVEYAVMEHFAVVFAYGDYSDLTDEEITEYEDWLKTVDEWVSAYYRDKASDYHWSVGDNLGFGRCEILATLGELIRVDLVVFLKD